GQVIISAGQSPGPLFVIDSGRCAVSVRGRQIAFLEAGECFGEISLLSGEPRTADVVAFTICNLFLIPALSILPIMQNNPLQPSVDVERLQRAGVILSHCSSACKEDMAGRVRPVIANAGDVLIRQGVSGRSLFFIEHGSCEVQVDGQQVRTLSSGDCFGEVSLM
ncbi:hypothetical protein GUITHDRAFT_45965, partial [Guillardia theta CCMP2712]